MGADPLDRRERGCNAETLRVRRSARDRGARPGFTSAERDRIKELEREVRELRTANETLKKARAYFARDGRIANAGALDGFVAALACRPEMISPSESMPVIQSGATEDGDAVVGLRAGWAYRIKDRRGAYLSVAAATVQ